MKSFTNDKNLDREILSKLNDRDFLIASNCSKYLRNIVCDEKFIKSRLSFIYPEAIEYKDKTQSWRQYYITIYYLIENGKYNSLYALENRLAFACSSCQINLVKFLIENGADVNVNNNKALRYATRNLYKDIEEDEYILLVCPSRSDIKYIIYKEDKYDKAVEIVKYLVEHGANIHAKNDNVLKYARKYKHTEMIEYLESLP